MELDPSSNIDSHSIFGRVCGGIDTVRRIGLVTTNEDERYILTTNSPQYCMTIVLFYRPTSDIVILRAYAVP